MLKPTEVTAVITLFARYSDVIEANADALRQMPEKCGYAHLVHLCNEAIQHHDLYPFDQLRRSMDFGPGVLASKGLMSVDEVRDFSRPLLHALHEQAIPSYP